MYLRHGTLLQGGKYKIEKTLGQGSFGITYLATANFSTDSNLGKMNVVAKVAIKEFFMSDVNSRKNDGSTVDGSTGNVFTNYRRKFRKEAENLAKLSHSNIVRVFDVFDENDTTYYVMEFLEGDNLDDYIKSKGRVGEEEAVAIIREIGGALDYMHSRKMLHLDLKPKNVMHRSDDTNHLIDFGLSKQFTDSGEPESSTTIGLGTPGYAPLEQAQYKQDGSFPATLDVYALGATMFKLLTGQRPPEATVILNEGFPREELKECGVSERTITAVEKAMTPARNQRWPSVRNFLNALPYTEDSEKEETQYVSNSETLTAKKNLKTNLNLEEEKVTPKIIERPTLASVWKSRNPITNWACVMGLLATLIGLNLDAKDNLVSVHYLFWSTASFLLGIIGIMYGNIRYIWLPFALTAVCASIEYGASNTYSPFEFLILAICFPVGYGVVISTLFLKKNGKSAVSLMRKEHHVSYEKTEKWPALTTVTTCFLTLILILAFLGVDDNRDIWYYDFGSWELIEIAICMLLIFLKKRMGMYLACVIIMLGYLRVYGSTSDTYGAYKFNYDYIVEHGMLIFYLIELAALTLIKKDGKSAWAMMG